MRISRYSLRTASERLSATMASSNASSAIDSAEISLGMSSSTAGSGAAATSVEGAVVAAVEPTALPKTSSGGGGQATVEFTSTDRTEGMASDSGHRAAVAPSAAEANPAPSSGTSSGYGYRRTASAGIRARSEGSPYTSPARPLATLVPLVEAPRSHRGERPLRTPPRAASSPPSRSKRLA